MPTRSGITVATTIATQGDVVQVIGPSNEAAKDVVDFLYAKISKKLVYWSTVKLSPPCMVVICNHILLSTLWFFITVWIGSNKILGKIREDIPNYMWSCKEKLTHTKVSWGECCLKKNNMVDLV